MQQTFIPNQTIFVSEDLVLKYLLTDDNELNKANKRVIDEKTQNHILWMVERFRIDKQIKEQEEAKLKKKIE